MIATLAEATTEPTLVHCFAGKDRTGVVIALTLAIVGVGVDAIADDYALSNDWAERFVDTNGNLARHWIFAPREAMTVFLAELVDAYGSVEGYLATAGVGPKEFDALRDNLLDASARHRTVPGNATAAPAEVADAADVTTEPRRSCASSRACRHACHAGCRAVRRADSGRNPRPAPRTRRPDHERCRPA